MSSAGLLEGIADVSQGVGMDVQPYVRGNYAGAPGRNEESSFDGDAGIDFIYNLTPALKANFTINTDFAETEVDQRRVNLTRFPLFFPERRSFFLEGTTVFEFSREFGSTIMPFFSRRIGLDENGQPQRIDYGAKMTGQIASNDIGLIHVRTGDSGNLRGEDFTVVRTKTNFLLQSYAGLVYSRRADQGADTPGSSYTGLRLCSRDLTIAGIRKPGTQWLLSLDLAKRPGARGSGVRISTGLPKRDLGCADISP